MLRKGFFSPWHSPWSFQKKMVGFVGKFCFLSSNRFQLCVVDVNQSEMLGTITGTGCSSLSDCAVGPFHSTAFPHSSSFSPLPPPPTLCTFSNAHFEKELGRHEEEKAFLTSLLAGCTHPISISMNQQNSVLAWGPERYSLGSSPVFALSYFYDSQNVYCSQLWAFPIPKFLCFSG